MRNWRPKTLPNSFQGYGLVFSPFKVTKSQGEQGLMSARSVALDGFVLMAGEPRTAPFHPRARFDTMPLSKRIAVEPPAGEVTQLLRDATSGSKAARDRLFQLVFPELRKLAAGKMRRERQGHTFSPTALVAE